MSQQEYEFCTRLLSSHGLTPARVASVLIKDYGWGISRVQSSLRRGTLNRDFLAEIER